MAPSSYYRTPSKPPATQWARHIDAWMRREGLSQTGAFRRLRGAFGLGEESRSAFLPYLINKPLDATQQAAVAAIIGWPPEVPEEPAPVLSLQERAVLAAERQADAAAQQTDLLRQILAALNPPAPATPPFSDDEVEQLREMARTVRPRPESRPRKSTTQPVVIQLR